MKNEEVENSKKYDKASFLWNMVASLIYSVQSPLLLLFVTRLIGLYEAGIFSITYTLAHMFTNVGLYNMRSYQVSDIYEEYRFSDYYSSRIITTITMITMCVFYALLYKYDIRKLQLVFLWIIYRATESLEDVYHGEIQKIGRLDIVSKIAFVRISSSMMMFLIILIISENLLYATSSLVTFSEIVYLFCNESLKKKYGLKVKLYYKNTCRLLYTCFPVFISSFLYSYFVNAPKFAIDTYLVSEMQSIFTIIFLPNMVINMMGMFFYKPLIVTISNKWKNNEIKIFKTLIIKHTLFLALGSILIVLVGAIIGLPILESIYGVDLNEYLIDFVLLLCFGGISALNNYYSVIITIMRKQKKLLLAYGVGVIACILVNNYLVENFMLRGATWSFGIIVLSIFGVLVSAILCSLKNPKLS